MANALTSMGSPLENQIRALWGAYGEWDAAGVDRVKELAALLQKQGITDISQFNIQNSEYTQPAVPQGAPMHDAYDPTGTPEQVIKQQMLGFGDQSIGFLGDTNNDGTYGSNSGGYLPYENLAAWSAQGKGNVGYRTGTDPKTGQQYIAPSWGGSSDWEDARDIAKGVAVVAGAGYLGGAFGGAGAVGGTTAGTAAATTAGTTGGTTGGIGTLGTIAPVSPAGAPLSTMGAYAAPSLGTVPSIAEVAAGAAGAVGAGSAGTAGTQAASLYGSGMTGAQTGVFDATLGATGSTGLASSLASNPGAASVMDSLISGGWGSYVQPALQVGGALLQQNSIDKASQAQNSATQAAIDEQRRQFDLTRGDYAPFRAAGVNALGQLQTQMGQMPTAQEVMAQPGYQFGLQQGQQAIDRKISAGGGRVSGAAIKAAGRYGTDYATTGYNAEYQRRQDSLNRLASLAGIGQTATGGTAAAGSNSTNQISGLISGQGDANAAALIGSGNVWGNTANSLASLWKRQQTPGT